MSFGCSAVDKFEFIAILEREDVLLTLIFPFLVENVLVDFLDLVDVSCDFECVQSVRQL